MVPGSRFIIALGAGALSLFLLSFISIEVSGGGSGAYPPPSNGDWNIYQVTEVWDEELYINGSVNLYSASLNLTNVTLYLNGHLFIDAPGRFSDTTVVIAKTGTAGGVEIKDPLILDNTTLKLNLTANPTEADEEQKIVVKENGTLLVYNNSHITDGDNPEDDDSAAPGADSANKRLRFIVEKGARFEVYDSMITEVGWANPVISGDNQDHTRGGLTINTPEVVMDRVTITRCWYGLYIQSESTNFTLVNSTLRSMDQNSIVSWASQAHFERNVLDDANTAFFAYYLSVDVVFRSNTIGDHNTGITLWWADRYNITNNTFSNITTNAFQVQGGAVSNDIVGNRIENCAYGLWAGPSALYGYQFIPQHLTFNENQLTEVGTGMFFNGGVAGNRIRAGGHNVTLANNTHDGGQIGIRVVQNDNKRLLDDFNITGNELINASQTGIQLTQLADSNISLNWINGSPSAIKIEDCEGLHLFRNRLSAFNNTGFSIIANAQANEVDNNTLEEFAGQGFHLRESGANEVHHNMLRDFSGVGFWIDDPVRGTLWNNTLRNGGTGFHLLTDSLTIDDNDLSDLDWGYYLLDVTLSASSDTFSSMTKGRLWQEFTTRVTVEDEDGNTHRNIEVEVYDAFGTLMGNGTSSTIGETGPFNLTQYHLDPLGLRVNHTHHQVFAYRGTGQAQEGHSVTGPDGMFTIQIDLVAPASWLVSHAAYVNQTRVPVEWRVLGDHEDVVLFHLEYQSREPDGEFGNWTLYGSYSGNTTLFNVTDGHYYSLRTRAQDDFGNIEEDPSNGWGFRADLTPPRSNLTAVDVTNGTKTALDTIRLEWGPGVDVLDIDTYTLHHRWRNGTDGTYGNWIPYGGQVDTRNLSIEHQGVDGLQYQFRVIARDLAGNRELKDDADITFLIDTLPPEAWLADLPLLIGTDELELNIEFPALGDLASVTVKYLQYTEERHDAGDPPTGIWQSVGTYSRTNLEESKIKLDHLTSDSYYLIRLVAEDDVGNIESMEAIEEVHTGNGSDHQRLELSFLPEPAGIGYLNSLVTVQVFDGESYSAPLRQSTKWPLDTAGTYYLNESSGTIHFGDGQQGYLPAAGQKVRVTYAGYHGWVLVDMAPPTKPGAPQYVHNTNGSITITWEASTSHDVTLYRLEHSEDVNWRSLTTLAAVADRGYYSKTLVGLNLTIHHFRVVAVDRIGLDSNPSGEVMVDLIPEEQTASDDDDENGGMPMTTLLLLLMVVVLAIGAVLFILRGRQGDDGDSGRDEGPDNSHLTPVSPVVTPGVVITEPAVQPPESDFEARSDDTQAGEPELDETKSEDIEPGPEKPADGTQKKAFSMVEGKLLCSACGSGQVEADDNTGDLTCGSCGAMGPPPDGT